MKQNVLEKLRANPLVAEEDKQKFYRFYNIANQVQFGKIAPRQEGYIKGDIKAPRCTSVLQMDGSKAGALMEWAKRQVAGRIEHILTGKLIKGDPITEWVIAEACQEGLMDPDRQKDEAADIGTSEHDNIENFLTGYEYEETEGLQKFKEAWQKSGLTIIATEIPIIWVSEDGRLAFGGRTDILAYNPAQRLFVLGDNKTSKSIHESYGCQVSAYAEAIRQMSHGDIQINSGVIFHIPDVNKLNDRQKKEYDKRGSLVYLKDLDDAFEHFKLLLGLYYRRNSKYF